MPAPSLYVVLVPSSYMQRVGKEGGGGGNSTSK